MHDGVRRFIADCASSYVGRLTFVAYLIYVASMLGHSYGHIPYLTYLSRFYGDRELFELMNWPQLELIRSSRLIFHWHASALTDALAAAYIAMPWWVYGYMFERIGLRIMDRAPGLADTQYHVLAQRRERKRLGVGRLLEWVLASCARQRLK